MVDKQEIIDMIRIKSPRLELVSFEAGKSEAWRWFKRVRVDGAVLPYAVCNGCFKPVHYTPRDGTGGLRRHACPLTVAMNQAKAGLKSPSGSASKASSSGRQRNGTGSGAATPDHGQQHASSASPKSRGGAGARRSATVPVSLTMWAAEKGLMDLTNQAGLPSGGMSIASAFAALQGIVPRCSPYLTSGSSGNPQAHQQLLQLPGISDLHAGSPKMADSALDLAMKKGSAATPTANSGDDDESDEVDENQRDADDDGDDENAPRPASRDERKDRAQSIVDHILLNISHQAKLELQRQEASAAKTQHDANQNEQTSRFSIVPSARSSTSTRRPRKRSNPDRAIPTGRALANGAGHLHPDIEANLQMLAHVANEPPAVKRERLSSPVDPMFDTLRYQSELLIGRSELSRSK